MYKRQLLAWLSARDGASAEAPSGRPIAAETAAASVASANIATAYIAGSALLTGAKAVLAIEKEAADEGPKFGPVSYTHLDVYKRQGPHHARTAH